MQAPFSGFSNFLTNLIEEKTSYAAALDKTAKKYFSEEKGVPKFKWPSVMSEDMRCTVRQMDFGYDESIIDDEYDDSDDSIEKEELVEEFVKNAVRYIKERML